MPQVVAAVIAALAVPPLRDLAQHRINQLVYGLRDDPAAAFARLGDRLDAAAEPAEMLPAAARTVAEALRLPSVAVELGGETLCRHGRLLPGGTEALPLPFAGESIGRLVWQEPAGGRLRPDKRRLLTGLTRQGDGRRPGHRHRPPVGTGRRGHRRTARHAARDHQGGGG